MRCVLSSLGNGFVLPLVPALFLAFALLLGCDGEPEPTRLKVVISSPGGSMGDSYRQGINAAITEWRENAPSLQIEPVYRETLFLRRGQRRQQDPAESPWERALRLERETAEAAAADPEVVAYIGPGMSEQAKISLPILNRAGIPQISTTATWPGLTEAGFGPGEPGMYYPSGRTHFFRLVPHDGYQATAAARWCIEMGYERIFVVHSSGVYSLGYVGIFTEAINDADLEIIGHYSWNPHSASPEELLKVVESIVEASPDVLYLADNSGRHTVRLLEELGARAPQLPVMAPDYLMRIEYRWRWTRPPQLTLLTTSPSSPEHFQWSTPGGSDFRERFVDLYLREPDLEAAKGYDAMSIVLHALTGATDRSREGLMEAIRSSEGHPGLFGSIAFDRSGDPRETSIYGYRLGESGWVHEVTL
ncbi:MAG: branched-chain amino acid ABC transporter substrate-binding protein [Acidobacteriota bacterium]